MPIEAVHKSEALCLRWLTYLPTFQIFFLNTKDWHWLGKAFIELGGKTVKVYPEDLYIMAMDTVPNSLIAHPSIGKV
jgi:hypothetical protein